MKTPWAFGVLVPTLVGAMKPLDKEKLFHDGKFPGVARIGEDMFPTQDQAVPPGDQIPPGDMTVSCTSETEEHGCSNVLDINIGTYWQNNNDSVESITVDLQTERSISGLAMIPHQQAESFIEKHSVSVSQDLENWKEVAYGMWWPDTSEKLSVFQPEKGRYLRLTVYQSAGLISELQVWEHEYIEPDPAKGAWGPTIDLPLVPVSGAIDPTSGALIGWSSWQYNLYLQNAGSKTQTTTWDPAKGTVTQREVSETNHDMFCTGISFDQDGNLVITGGNSGHSTSIYNTTTAEWQPGALMSIDRGYQASTVVSDGRIFLIGGSFSDTFRVKNGAIYNVDENQWSNLRNDSAVQMWTSEPDKWRKDNHAWLFGWKDGYVFHAGPSTKMNWFGTQGDGSTVNAGERTDEDAMCGNAVMFEEGKIVTFGGSPYYENTTANQDTFLITIDEPDTDASVVKASDMNHRRTFHSSVVLPDGSVFVSGGQDVGVPFDESGSQLEPERFVYNAEDPAASTWETLLPNTVARVYHSLALLLRDGTVFAGAGGLCGNCSANHFDGQIFTPPYLLNADGSQRDRPEIVSVEPSAGKPGDTIVVTTNGDINPAASSIIRYGSATHTVDTDQRRVAVPFSEAEAGTDGNRYTFQIPEEAGVAAPGYYMLFVLDGQGTPSHSVNVQVTV